MFDVNKARSTANKSNVGLSTTEIKAAFLGVTDDFFSSSVAGTIDTEDFGYNPLDEVIQKYVQYSIKNNSNYFVINIPTAADIMYESTNYLLFKYWDGDKFYSDTFLRDCRNIGINLSESTIYDLQHNIHITEKIYQSFLNDYDHRACLVYLKMRLQLLNYTIKKQITVDNSYKVSW